jgi:phosphoglycolate phosphatase-like HAD superfamily hydrolase
MNPSDIERYKIIIWDFDGVIINSMPIRDAGFANVLKDYPENEVEQLMAYHKQNAGLSRYAKFRYFFEQIRHENVGETVINSLAHRFKDIMLSSLIDEKLLIRDSLTFIKNNCRRYEQHIASGSDQTELRTICKALGLTMYFRSINGSPVPKTELVQKILQHCQYTTGNALLIGDSINDYEAAVNNQIDFAGYNNSALRNTGRYYIETFTAHAAPITKVPQSNVFKNRP